MSVLFLVLLPLEPGMWVELVDATAGLADPDTSEERDIAWCKQGRSESKEYLCPDGSPVTSVSVFDRMGGSIGGMVMNVMKESTDMGVLGR